MVIKRKVWRRESEAFHADVARLEAGEPLAYVIGHIPFFNTTIHLDNHPLIPRPETEYWVEKAVAEIQNSPQPRVLDLCAGSGAIGVAVAKAIPKAFVCFTEIDDSLLDGIATNLATNDIAAAQHHVLQSDLFTNVTGTFDFILTNPPYIDPELDRTEPSVTSYEPHLALYGGTRGMYVIEKIISTAPAHLNKDGQLWIEHEPEQVSEITLLAAKHGFTSTSHEDQYGHLRYSVLVIQ